METRKLASIQIIERLTPIKDADLIEKAKILGWDVVVKKGDFKEGDPCLYLEIDSLLPDIPIFAFINREPEAKGGGLRKDRSRRLRTKKIKKVISQGLAMPVALIGQIADAQSATRDHSVVKHEFTEWLGVTKYEPPITMHANSNAKGAFPTYVPKTDEIRIQSIPGIFDKIERTDPFYITTKLDGTSGTFVYTDKESHVCSRNLSLKDSVTEGTSKKESYYWAMEKKYDILNKLKTLGINMAIQGEICGPGIQKNKLNLSSLDLFLFDVYFIDEEKYGSIEDLEAISLKLAIPMVPVLQRNFTFCLDFLQNKEAAIEHLLQMAEGKYQDTKNEREGIVVRCNNTAKRLSFKVVSNQFLLKNDS